MYSLGIDPLGWWYFDMLCLNHLQVIFEQTVASVQKLKFHYQGFCN